MVPHEWKSKQLDLQLIKIIWSKSVWLRERYWTVYLQSVISNHSFPGDGAMSWSVVYEKELCMFQLLQMHG